MKGKKFKDDKSNKSNGKSRSRKSNRQYDRDNVINNADNKHGIKGSNDISWYTRNADLVDSAARVPFAYQPGRAMTYNVGYNKPELQFSADEDFKVQYPGIMSLGFAVSVGVSDDLRSPINIAAREIYGKIRSKYSGSLEADAPDLMMYLLALDSIYMLYEDMKRAYYLINQYTPYNNFYPKTVLKALGWDLEDLLENKVYMYQTIVEAGAMINKFLVPDVMDLFKRHQFMTANIYADSPDPKSQHYVFRPVYYYALSNTESMTQLSTKMWTPVSLETDATFLTVASARQKLFDAINLVMSWDTSYTILGYFERAYEGTGFMAVSPVIEDGVLSPVYNEVILQQIHNATIVPLIPNGITQDVVNGNKLMTQPRVFIQSLDSGLFGHTTLPDKVILSLPTGTQPSSTDIILATRLTTVWSGDSNKIDSGTEILCSCDIFLDPNEGSQFHTESSSTYIVFEVNPEFGAGADSSPIPNEDMIDHLRLMSALSAFHYHPTMQINVYKNEYIADVDESRVSAVYPIVLSELENTTLVDHQDMKNLHRMCIYSEFNCFN